MVVGASPLPGQKQYFMCSKKGQEEAYVRRAHPRARSRVLPLLLHPNVIIALPGRQAGRPHPETSWLALVLSWANPTFSSTTTPRAVLILVPNCCVCCNICSVAHCPVSTSRPNLIGDSDASLETLACQPKIALRRSLQSLHPGASEHSGVNA
jgi:hypothetical protein